MRDFLNERNKGVYFRANKIPRAIKDQARARHTRTVSGLTHDGQQRTGVLGFVRGGIGFRERRAVAFFRVCNRAVKQLPALARRFVLQRHEMRLVFILLDRHTVFAIRWQ